MAPQKLKKKTKLKYSKISFEKKKNCLEDHLERNGIHGLLPESNGLSYPLDDSDVPEGHPLTDILDIDHESIRGSVQRILEVIDRFKFDHACAWLEDTSYKPENTTRVPTIDTLSNKMRNFYHTKNAVAWRNLSRQVSRWMATPLSIALEIFDQVFTRDDQIKFYGPHQHTLFDSYKWKSKLPEQNPSAEIEDPEEFSFVVAYQSPFILDSIKMKEFAECKAFPTPDISLKGTEARKYRLWAEIWDLCKSEGIKYFALTSGYEWVFGAFSTSMRKASVSSVIVYDHPWPTVPGLLAYWIVESMGLSKGDSLIKTVSEPIPTGMEGIIWTAGEDMKSVPMSEDVWDDVEREPSEDNNDEDEAIEVDDAASISGLPQSEIGLTPFETHRAKTRRDNDVHAWLNGSNPEHDPSEDKFFIPRQRPYDAAQRLAIASQWMRPDVRSRGPVAYGRRRAEKAKKGELVRDVNFRKWWKY